MTPLVALNRAQISRDTSGGITVDDPESPLLISVSTTPDGAHIGQLVVTIRHPSGRITPRALSRLPLQQIRHIAAQTVGHPNDQLWRALITPKASGSRHWPSDHWDQVLAVYEWARTSGRPGGGTQAIADLWGVARNPTASRWLTTARRHKDTPRAAAAASNADAAAAAS
jgi:hypothetical protein